MLVSIDPGVRLAGVACWDDGELTAAWLVRAPKDGGYLPWEQIAISVVAEIADRQPPLGMDLAIEKPQIYHQSKQRGDQGDLIDVALAVGAIAARFAMYQGGVTFTYLPQAWKGSAPKDVMVERIKRRLTPEEHARIDLPRAKSLRHNVWDAIGIGLHQLKRR